MSEDISTESVVLEAANEYDYPGHIDESEYLNADENDNNGLASSTNSTRSSFSSVSRKSEQPKTNPPFYNQESRKSSSVRENASTSTVPKKQLHGADSAAGVKALLEKKKRSQSLTTAVTTSENKGASKGARGTKPQSFFTLDHVKKLFVPSKDPQTAQNAPSQKTYKELERRFSNVTVSTLPQKFNSKLLGSYRAAGLFGIDSIRRPIDKLLKLAQKAKMESQKELDIYKVNVYFHGVELEPRNVTDDSGKVFYPIESVSYAAMDTKYSRIFGLVTVDITRAGPRNPVCHAFICSSSEIAYKMVLSVTFAFNSAVNRSKAEKRHDDDSSQSSSLNLPVTFDSNDA